MMRTSDAAFDEADLNGFVDGRIEPARAAALAESLASDPEARARIDGWKRQNESLRTMFASVLFEPVPARLLARSVPARPSELEPSSARAAAPRPAAVRGALVSTAIGAALVGVILGALASLGTDHFGLARAPSPAAASAPATRERALTDVAVEAHRTYVLDPLRPVELTGAEAPRLARWMQRRLGSAARLPDLTRQGWTLLGGRILPGPRGPAGFLLYGSGTDRLGLTLSRSAEPSEVSILGHDGPDPVSSVSWADDVLGYVLTSGHGAAWLARNAGPLAAEIRAQAGDADPLP